MKIKSRTNETGQTSTPGFRGNPKYYFHADEDFREDWTWGKSSKETASVASPMSASKLRSNDFKTLN